MARPSRVMDSGSYMSLNIGNPLCYILGGTLCYIVSGVAILVVGVIITSVTFQNLDHHNDSNKERYAGPILIVVGILIMGKGAVFRIKESECRILIERRWQGFCRRLARQESEQAIYLGPSESEEGLCDDPPPYDSMGTRRAVVARCLPGSLSSLPPYEEGGLGNPSLGLTNPGLCLSRETLPMPPPYEAPSQPPPDYQPSHDPQVVDNAPHDENSNPTTVDPGVTETVTRDTAVAMDTRDAMNTAAATETTTWQNPENCSGQNSLQRNCCREASTVNNNQPLQDNDEVIASAQNSSSISCDSELRSSVESSDLTGSSDAGMEEDVESPHSEYQPDSRWQHLARSRSPYRGQLGEERDTVGDTVDSEDKTSDSVSSIAMEVTCPVKDDSPGDVGHSH